MPVELTTTQKVRVSITGAVKFQPGTATATVEDPNIAAITLDPNDHEAEISGLRPGSTKFTISGKTENSPSGAPGRTVSESDTVTVADSATPLGFEYGTPVERDANDAPVVVEPVAPSASSAPSPFHPASGATVEARPTPSDPHELLGRSSTTPARPTSADPHEIAGKN
jgi:hypothetical protein